MHMHVVHASYESRWMGTPGNVPELIAVKIWQVGESLPKYRRIQSLGLDRCNARYSLLNCTYLSFGFFMAVSHSEY